MKSKPFYFYTWPIQAWLCKTLVPLPWPFPVYTRKLILAFVDPQGPLSLCFRGPWASWNYLQNFVFIFVGRGKPWISSSSQKTCQATAVFIFQAWETSVKGSMGHTSVYTTVRKCRSSRLPIQETQGQQSSWKQAHCFYLTSVFLWCLGMRW